RAEQCRDHQCRDPRLALGRPAPLGVLPRPQELHAAIDQRSGRGSGWLCLRQDETVAPAKNSQRYQAYQTLAQKLTAGCLLRTHSRSYPFLVVLVSRSRLQGLQLLYAVGPGRGEFSRTSASSAHLALPMPRQPAATAATRWPILGCSGSK